MSQRFTLAPHEPPTNPPDPADDPRLVPGWSPTTPHGKTEETKEGYPHE